MKLRTLLMTSALALTAVAGVAQADTSAAPQAVPYHYGMPLNIDKLISMTEQPTSVCKVINADMKFVDKAGKIEDVTYRKMSQACDFNN
ncbi:DUF2790 domain-containing protein [Pseudomonas gingeri NCPPB 3146 = LMG 5327]|uniref:DUF2790 domain-containing protein n=2 Tax=Pseudomonas gingeri TaxID=117681 RepID=A0A7Y7XYJ6_9PSED|nr:MULTISPECIES: DUF2790 domain-containing protein [Pseudomonas]NVZ24473.1 DUF2790 domain-containing protein [Pseudomonas gingeri]NVZ63436.1 DUF2790 domain-containing protein [Pseudomonas gingeri]NVZ75917.1 DUF2790 domain-containing protein [Pseudomonas gingeri]NWA11455.1 DUF2790 domain-containing protein [Pseudomonas gingeri]NWC13462.1 DUF2790 domain-containing protein [Pseudomonas gingeri]